MKPDHASRPRPFHFKKITWLVEASGQRAGSLDELLRLLTVADPDAIGFHMHREFLQVKFAHAEWPNDFAYWAARVLGDEVLGERLANLRVSGHPDLGAVQRELARIVADHSLRFPQLAQVRVPQGREFNLCSAVKFVMATGKSARTLEELTAAVGEVESSSLFYHLFEARHDFPRFVEEQLGDEALATRLRRFDPYMFSLEQARAQLVKLLGEAAR
jgi:hypothetical protein